MKEIINGMKNLSMKVMYVCGKAVTEKAYVDQLLKERLDAGIARKSASDTLEIVLPAEFNPPGSPIFKAVQKQRCKALCRALKKSPKSPASAVGAGSEPSYVDRSVGAP